MQRAGGCLPMGDLICYWLMSWISMSPRKRLFILQSKYKNLKGLVEN
ncbi:unnamed protein product [Musa acuminata subsp. malaccensis]|uniref:(wild Malaysian banana) hypothetical protein n=1 Tax=Musa acuminata subsp. malaccensis TaxID=214687 RepID=A0A804KQI1_MUSAM|nr:unnamed protein product [Musa acuminata subsp. malaccensis]